MKVHAARHLNQTDGTVDENAVGTYTEVGGSPSEDPMVCRASKSHLWMRKKVQNGKLWPVGTTSPLDVRGELPLSKTSPSKLRKLLDSIAGCAVISTSKESDASLEIQGYAEADK